MSVLANAIIAAVSVSVATLVYKGYQRNRKLQAEIDRGNRAARDAARTSEARLASYVEAAPQGILAVDQRGRIQLVNSRLEEIFGYPREELLGQSLDMLLPERFRARHGTECAEFFLHPRQRVISHQLDLWGQRKDGTEFPAEIGLSYLHTEDGVLAIGLVSDITERKEIAGQLAQANADLRRSNEELERFAHVASHDLQEPLRMITSYLQLLARRYSGQLDAEASEFIHYAVDGAARMKALINGLLDYSRAGTQRLRREPTDIAEIVKAALDNLRTSIDESGAEIAVAEMPEVPGDPVQLTQLFQNLLANGIKFRREGPPRIQVAAARESADWVFTVRDNGIGIDPQYSDRIFQIFQRLHGADEFPGTGVGLAICKRIVETHGGRIWLQPTSGEGATFCFSVPAQGVAAHAREQTAAR